MDLLFVPVHLGVHWCMAVVDMRQRQLAYYDSLHSDNPECFQVPPPRRPRP